MGQAVQVIRGAIKRVNNPAAGRVFAFDFVAFFTQPAIVRTRFGQFFADQFFGLKVGFGNKVPGALGGHLQVFDLAEIADQGPASLAGGFDHDVQICACLGHWASFKMLRSLSTRQDVPRQGAIRACVAAWVARCAQVGSGGT